VAALREAGHECVAFTPVRVEESVCAYFALIGADGWQGVLKELRNEPLEPALTVVSRLYAMPAFVRSAMARALQLKGWARMARITAAVGKLSVGETCHWQERQQQLRAHYFDAFRDAGIDVLLTPVLAVPPPQHGTSAPLGAAMSYTMLWNLLDFPAGTVPITRVIGSDLSPKRNASGDLWERMAAAIDEDSVALPISVQVIGLPWQDARVLRAMRELETRCPFVAGTQMRLAHLTQFYR